jgi:predicted GNAT family acetyltransferase
MVGGRLAGWLDYSGDDATMILVHTEVNDDFAGHGVGTELAAYAFDVARGRHARVIVRCSFIAGYVDHHPEVRDLLA